MAFNEKISFIITWIVSTIILAGLVFFISDFNSLSENAWIFLFLPISALFFPTPLILIIQDGPYKFLDKEKEIKARYINKEVENKYLEYIYALENYEHYVKQNNEDYWINMTGIQFEKAVALLFRNIGYNAIVTSATADGGVDIILTKGNEKIAVQCKHHSKPVGPNDVRALQGVVAAKNYSKGIFVSLNGYTSTVYYEVTNGNVKIELLDLRDILQMAKGDCKSLIQKGTLIQDEASSKKEEGLTSIWKNLDEDNIKKLLGKTVSHAKYGKGLITHIIEYKYITVYFSNTMEEKKFVFPDAFIDKYITPLDFNISKS